MIGIIFSVITSITAIIALIQANRQMKLSNKQQLFDRRLKAYMTVHGLLELYRQNRHIFEMDKKNEVQRTIDLEYKWLTNNIFMAEICEVIDDPLEINYRRKFMKKCEELQALAMEVQFVFQNGNIKSYRDFLIYYKETLLQMCRYQMVFLKMCKENEKKPMRVEDWGKAFGEERYRKELCDIMVKLKNTYMEIIDNQVEEKIKQEIKLK